MDSILAFIIVIGILVFVHELGHFLTAKWTGMRADVFAIGMGPRMLGWNRVTGFSFGPLPADTELGNDTDYRICWLPIGGYVKILGMVDESMDTEFANRAPAPYEFRSKNAWQKTLVLSAGVIMNLLLAIALFAFIHTVKGSSELLTTTVGYVEPGSLAAGLDIEGGDNIVAINGKKVPTWEAIVEELGVQGTTSDRVVLISRDGVMMKRTFRSADVVHAVASGEGVGIYPSHMAVTLGSVITYGPADRAGLKQADRLLAIDTMPVRAVSQVQHYIRKHAGKQVTVHVDRNGETMPLTVNIGNDSAIKVGLESSYDGPKLESTIGVFQAAGMAVSDVQETVGLIVSSIGHVFQGDVSVRQSFGGPIKIAKMAARSQELGWDVFLRFMALISISLAVMNILPLPGLDGGHLVFVFVEAVIRREIPTSIKIRIQQVGMVLLLALMAFVLYLDLT